MIVRALVSAFLAMAMAGAPQQLDMSATVSRLADKAKRKTEISLDQSMLNLASAFLSDSDQDQAAAKKILEGLKGLYVRVFEFDTPGQYAQSDLDPLRRQLQGAGWGQIVSSTENHESAGVWIRKENGAPAGLVVLVTNDREVTLVNLVGTIRPEDLAALGGQFGIPKVPPAPPTPPAR
jgi:Domain of unknown function (DUF4252)